MFAFYSYFKVISLLVLYKVYLCDTQSWNRPIIGILSQEYEQSPTQSFIAASYVKYIESAGARVMPVMIDRNEDYYKKVVDQTNGLLFPGGVINIGQSDAARYTRAGQMILKLALENKTREYPIWGTCLGFELLVVLVSNRTDILEECDANDVNSYLKFVDKNTKNSRLFGGADQKIIENLSNKEFAPNYHGKCLNASAFNGNSKLKEFFTILSTSVDRNGMQYISTIESKNHKIYGVQWHPEKSQFEFTINADHLNIPHELEAIQISQYMANFFVNEARNTSRQLIDEKAEKHSLIYNYLPKYTGNVANYTYEQIYVFNNSTII